ncbi:AraC family transcriptional regulator [Sunxiuqinia elliptica]|uniref:AraC family transcriptional regulator n=1 Tax=Sunxiuqinia elliptica TaxID=655355 RepID=A0A4R6GU85_9BACT|nr:AraC family transcriptional regulator [Sunxiuqinia elliptica]TDN98390.1 AraC family transcriptional regulator [Sunxiuqinia elliptica]TDO60493.1 AraC family transcriptional regulator [Sunxiuqinia elliptica]
MKMLYEKVSITPESLIITRWNKSQHFMMPMHFHDEYELIYIAKSFGTRYVGDSLEPFKEGDLVLVGSKLPHTWQNNEIFIENPATHPVRAVVIQFGLDFVSYLNRFPEFQHISNMLELAQRGIAFSDKVAQRNRKALIQLPDAKYGFHRLISILTLLHNLAADQGSSLLASSSFQNIDKESSLNRITQTLDYIAQNYTQKLTLDDIASKFNMSISAFSNFFKRKTGKTVINYINELRISEACKLLSLTDKNIAEVAFECGFNNLSNFNRTFKEVTSKTPKEYRLLWQIKT